jgi:DNA-binding CsgD family transcriptional regulator
MIIHLNIQTRMLILALSVVILILGEGFLLVDLIDDFEFTQAPIISDSVHTELENGAALALLFVIVVFLREIRELYRSQKNSEKALNVAYGYLSQVIVDQLKDWQLTESETEIALLLMKGLSLQEIADIRSAQIGTIKSHSSSIYKKANVAGRSELVSYFMEDLLSSAYCEYKPK